MTQSDVELRQARIIVRDAESGRTLLSRGAATSGPTASVMKVVTCGAALAALPADFCFETEVFASAPGEILLKGGGDVTLSRQQEDKPTLYDDAPRITDLAAATQAELSARGLPVPTKLVIDTSRYAGGEWNEGNWIVEDRTEGGDICFMSALMVDGDRITLESEDSPCGEQPAQRAAEAFAGYFGCITEIAHSGSANPSLAAPNEGRPLATLRSRQLPALVEECLRKSDNPLAEALAKEVSLSQGAGPDFASVGKTLASYLPETGLPRETIAIKDGSGLSEENSLPAAWIVELLTRAAQGEQPYARVLKYLPQSGSTMSEKRFTGSNCVGDAVRAKSGFINTVHSLAGIVRTKQGKHLVFGVFVDGKGMKGDDPARAAIDSFVAKLHREGDQLLALKHLRDLPSGESALSIQFADYYAT